MHLGKIRKEYGCQKAIAQDEHQANTAQPGFQIDIIFQENSLLFLLDSLKR